MPTNQDEAVEAMVKDAVALREIFGNKCFDTYLRHRKSEFSTVGSMTRAERSGAIIWNI